MNLLKALRLNYDVTYALQVVASIILALAYTQFISATKEGFAVIAAFIVMQTTRGTPFSQGLYWFLMAGLLLLGTVFLSQLIALPYLILLWVVSIYLIQWIGRRVIHLNLPMFATSLAIIIIFYIGFVLFMQQQVMWRDAFIDLMSGGLIGLMATQLIYPVQVISEYKKALGYVFSNMSDECKTLAITLEKNLKDQSINKTSANMIRTQCDVYPHWVYEMGFNPGLRSGFRYYLVQIDRLHVLLFTIQYRLPECQAVLADASLRELMQHVLSHHADMAKWLSDYFMYRENRGDLGDMKSDIAALENAVDTHSQGKMIGFDANQSLIALFSIVRDLKDMRQIYLQLLMGLPHQ